MGENTAKPRQGRANKIRNKFVIIFALALIFALCSMAHASSPLSSVSPGTIITFSGREWYILEQMPNGQTYILMRDLDSEKQFDPNNTQIFDPTDSNNLACYLNNEFYNGLLQKDLVESHTWDTSTIDNGGNVTVNRSVNCKVGLISYHEYKAYGGIYPDSYAVRWWTLSPRAGISCNVWAVHTSGDLSYIYANNTYGVRPALYLKSNLLVDENKVVLGESSSLPPVAPTGLTVSAESSDTVKLNWDASAEEDLAGYKIYRDNTKIAEVGKTQTYTDNTVEPDTTYKYEITAYNASGQESPKSAPATVKTPSDIPVPVTPTNIKAQATGKRIKLTWQCPGNPLFVVERSTDGTTFVPEVEVTATTYTDIPPLWNTTYYYRVAQKGQDGQLSDFTNPVQAATGPVPVPANLTAILEGNDVELSWSNVQDIEGYRVDRSADGKGWETLALIEEIAYTDKNIDPNVDYYYRVLSDGGKDQLSEPSPAVEITKPIPAKPCLVYSVDVDNKIVELSWDYQERCDGYKVYIDNELKAELTRDDKSYSFTCEVGETYAVELKAYNEYGEASAFANIRISQMTTPGAGAMAKDVLVYTGVATASMGGLLAIGLALQGSQKLMGVLKYLFRR